MLLSAIFCYSGHLGFLVRLKGGAILCFFFCYFLLFWGRQPHQIQKNALCTLAYEVHLEMDPQPPTIEFEVNI